MSVKIVVADDHRAVRQTLRVCLDEEDDLQVVAEASDGQEAIEAVARTHPDVVVLDYRMPRIDGLTAARVIATAQEDIRIIIITADDDPKLRAASRRAGVHGFLLKTDPVERVLSVVRSVVAGGEETEVVSIPDVADVPQG